MTVVWVTPVMTMHLGVAVGTGHKLAEVPNREVLRQVLCLALRSLAKAQCYCALAAGCDGWEVADGDARCAGPE